MPPSPQLSFALPATRRIKESREFARIKANGRRFSSGCVTLNWSLLPESPSARLGVVVSRKVGNAVIRARAKRLLREVFRLHQGELPKSLQLVLVARPSITKKRFAGVEQDILSALRQMHLVPGGASH